MQKNIIILVLVACLFYSGHANDDEDYSVEYDKESLDADIAEKNLFVMFFAPWCGHCKRLKPTWNELAKDMNVEGSQVTIGKVDCTQHREACSSNGVSGYPTLKFFAPGKDSVKFASMRTLDAMKEFIMRNLGEEEEAKEPEAEVEVAPAEAKNGLYELTDANFQSHIKKGHHFVKFYAPWCGHCKRLAPTWDALAASYKDNDKVTIAKVDCTQHSKACSSQGIRGYPTLLWFTDGVKAETYNQARSEDAFEGFINKIAETYNQARSEDALKGFINKIVGAPAEDNEASDEGKVPEVKEEDVNLVVLTDYDFKDTVSDDFTFVMFSDQQCAECVQHRVTLEKLGAKFVDKTEYLFATVDCTGQKTLCKNEGVEGGFPQFKLYFNSKAVDDYTGGRTVDAIEGYMARKEKELQPKHGGEL